MPFDQTPIVEVYAPTWNGGQIFIRWRSLAPGAWTQVYVARKLAWRGIASQASVSSPVDGRVRIDVGVVGDTEKDIDFSSSLPSLPGDRVTLSWLGGTFQGADLSGFRVYGSPAAGQGVDFNHRLADIPAYTSGVYTDGFGLGGFGEGGFGTSSGSYMWTSGALSTGDWTFAVTPYDVHENEGVSTYETVSIFTAPLAPARGPRGSRLRYAYDSTTRRATLYWLPSPG